MYSRFWLARKHWLILNIPYWRAQRRIIGFFGSNLIQKNHYWILSCLDPSAANKSNLKARENKINKIANFV